MPCTHYFDDFAIVIPEVLATYVDTLAKGFFRELGWAINETKDKRLGPFASVFPALGVEFDLGEALGEDPRIVVKNRQDRIDEIVKRIDDHIGRDSMSPSEASELRGRLVFSNSRLSGAWARPRTGSWECEPARSAVAVASARASDGH